VTEPIFWLALSLFFVAVSLTAVLMAAFPAFQELARAAHSAEKLFDTLNREFPPTLEAIRLTGLEITELTDELNSGVKSASQVVQQVDKSLLTTKEQISQVHRSSRGLVAGFKAAWQTWNR
jgi:FtsZ-binding cell division protein ZapB